MKATTPIAIIAALMCIAAHWVAGSVAADWKRSRVEQKKASTQVGPPQEPVSPTPKVEDSMPQSTPVTPSESVAEDAALTAASRMRLAGLSGLGSDFAASWDSGAASQAWLEQLGSLSYKHVWPYFFSGALLVAGPTSESQIVAFYNPYADAALLTEWSRSADRCRISNAAVVLGSELAGTDHVPETDAPRWCKQEGPLFERLAKSLASFRQEFPSVSSRLLKKNGEFSSLEHNRSLRQVEQRCLALTVELTRLCATKSTEPSAAGMRNLMHSLASGTFDGLPGADDNATSEIQKLGSERLARMKPVFATQFANGCQVFLIEAGNPETLLAALFSGTGEIRLENLQPRFFPRN
jgi:hypothetical protein